MLMQIIWRGHTIGEVTCPTMYFPEMSSINLRRASKYAVGCLWISLIFRLARWGLCKSKILQSKGPGEQAGG